MFITTPIPYSNAQPHIGHSLEAVVNDAFSRYFRLKGEKVTFSMGVDQNGLKNYQTAQKEGLEPSQFVQRETQKFVDLWKQLDISYDVFTQTHFDKKHQVVAEICWNKLVKRKLLYKKEYTGLYCVGCEAFYSTSQLLENNVCPIHLKEAIEMREENYFFKLSEFSSELTEYLESTTLFPAYSKKEWLNFINSGLEDIPFSREKINLPWGISVPGEESQIMYIWFEALVNYLTAMVDEESTDKYLEFPEQKAEFEKEIWDQIEKNTPIDLIYLGKDIAKFHLVIWPAILLALGLPLTKVNLVHGFINDKNGHKMSKSLGNVVSPYELLSDFGVDGIRFLLLHEVNLLEDTSFDIERSINSYNSILAGNLGNLVVRVSNLIEKYCDGSISEPDLDEPRLLDLKKVMEYMDSFDTNSAIKQLFVEVSKINQYLEQTKPWELAKDLAKNQVEINRILSNCANWLLEVCKILSVFLPGTSEKIYRIFNESPVVKAEVIFPKIEKTSL